MAGVHCFGFFGSTKSCIDLAWFRVVVVVFYPLVFLPATLLISGTLGFGLWDELRQSKKNTKVSR